MDAQKAKTTMDAINSRLAAGGCSPTNLAEIKSIVDFHDKSKLECELARTQKFLHDKELEWKQKEYDYLMEIKDLKEEKAAAEVKADENFEGWFQEFYDSGGFDDAMYESTTFQDLKERKEELGAENENLKTEVKDLKEENDEVASLTTELLTVKADLKFQKEVSTQLQKECDTEHIRYLDATEIVNDLYLHEARHIRTGEKLESEISVIKSSNKQKTKIIKKLKKENEELKTEVGVYRDEQDEYIDELFEELNVDDIDDIVPAVKKLKEELEKSTENEERLLAQQFDGMMERIKELKEEFEDGIQAIADALMGEGEDADALCLTPFAPKIIAEIKKL